MKRGDATSFWGGVPNIISELKCLKWNRGKEYGLRIKVKITGNGIAVLRLGFWSTSYIPGLKSKDSFCSFNSHPGWIFFEFNEAGGRTRTDTDDDFDPLSIFEYITIDK